MRELHEILSAMVAQKDKVRDRRELLLDMADRIVKTVSHEFSLKLDEVAILLLSTDGRHLRFVAPRRFADLGTIPVTKRDSIAVSVLSRRSGEVINNVPMVKHVSFFESIKLRDKPAPIQKMVSTPLVVRVSRSGWRSSAEGETGREAGPTSRRPICAAPRRCSTRWPRTWRRPGPRATERGPYSSRRRTKPLSSTRKARPIGARGVASMRKPSASALTRKP